MLVNDPGVGRDVGEQDTSPAQEVAAEITAAGGTAVADHRSIFTEDGARGARRRVRGCSAITENRHTGVL